MSDADPDAITVSAGDVTVHKTLVVDQFQTPAVVFDVVSEAGVTLPIQVVSSAQDPLTT